VAAIRPTVTVVIAAYNEAAGIRAKLDNVSSLQIFARFGRRHCHLRRSSDGTDEIVKAYDPSLASAGSRRGPKGQKQPARMSPCRAQRAKSSCFTDATTRIEPHALTALMRISPISRSAAPQDLWCTKIANQNPTGAGGAAYWSYEVRLRRAESALGSLVGVSGLSVCRAGARPIGTSRPNSISDFVIALHLREQGMRTVLEPARLLRGDACASGQELAMRVRVAVRTIYAWLPSGDC